MLHPEGVKRDGGAHRLPRKERTFVCLWKNSKAGHCGAANSATRSWARSVSTKTNPTDRRGVDEDRTEATRSNSNRMESWLATAENNAMRSIFRTWMRWCGTGQFVVVRDAQRFESARLWNEVELVQTLSAEAVLTAMSGVGAVGGTAGPRPRSGRNMASIMGRSD
jgi:hypothetical protein